jgi:amidase
MKPTVGLVSRGGIVPISHSQDTAGPMARTVRDAALLLEVLAGRDPADAATVAKGPRFDARYSAALDRGALKGARRKRRRLRWATTPRFMPLKSRSRNSACRPSKPTSLKCL